MIQKKVYSFGHRNSTRYNPTAQPKVSSRFAKSRRKMDSVIFIRQRSDIRKHLRIRLVKEKIRLESSILPSPILSPSLSVSFALLFTFRLWRCYIFLLRYLFPIQSSFLLLRSGGNCGSKDLYASGQFNVVSTVTNTGEKLLQTKSWNSKLYANSLIGVGIASTLYHTSRGEMRKYLKWADYTMIAATTVCLSRALREDNPKYLMTASTLLLPFQPLMVSALHTGMMEVSFAKKASVKPELRIAHNLHTMSGFLGGALFFADDCFPETPYLHAAWHLAAALGVGTCNKLLE